MTLRDEWTAFTETDPDTWEDFEYTDKELALAYELARMFQADPPTMLQVSYFVEDAEGLAGDIPDQPWVIRKSFMPNQRYMWLVLINDVLCGLDDAGDNSPLEVLGKLPTEWEAAAGSPLSEGDTANG